MELIKNAIHTVDIDGVSSEGAGVARIDGRAVFVAGALPGERCKIKLLKVTKTAVYAKIEELIEPSKHRIKPECRYFDKCGGCDFLHTDYAEELRIKEARVNDALRRIGGLELTVSEIIGAPSRSRYRNKAIFTVSREMDKAVTGFFRPRSHQLIAVESCLIQSKASEIAARCVREWMDSYFVPHYDETTGKGLIKHVFVRTAAITGMAAVCIVSNGDIPHKAELIDLIISSLPETASIVLNINKSRGNTVLSGSFKTIWGTDSIEDRILGLRFKLSPMSFFQINSSQIDKLYSTALDFAQLTGKEQVLDLYCGTGTIGLCAAAKASKVIGIETVQAAIEDAKENAMINNIKNAEFICADAGQAAMKLAAGSFYPDVVFLDPPRKGLAKEVIEAVAQMSPERIVYVSCDPATLARDLKLFEEYKYAAKKATAVDMFPGTVHCETVVMMSHQNP